MQLEYASRSFMVRQLPAMGLSGSAATVAKRLRQPLDYDDSHPTPRYAESLHRDKGEADTLIGANVNQSIQEFQTMQRHGNQVRGAPQVTQESPNDMWVDPQRAAVYRTSSVHVSDRELVRANEPWRFYTDYTAVSIKHHNTK